jgi:hypothetical protein
VDRKLLLQAVIELGGLEQRLGGYAAGVQAGATEGGRAIGVLPLIDARHGQLVLRRADRGGVTGGTCADDDDVERISASRSFGIAAHGNPQGRDSALFFKSFRLREHLEK